MYRNALNGNEAVKLAVPRFEFPHLWMVPAWFGIGVPPSIGSL